MEKRLFRPEEVAEMFSIGRSTVYEAMRTGALESVTLGRARRVPAEALDAFVAALRSEKNG